MKTFATNDGMGRALLCAALVTMTAACSSSGAEDPSGADGGLVGKPAPEIQAEPVGGEGPTNLSEARGKVAIVDFWATYCDPCRKSFPVYQQMVDKYGGDLVVIGVSVDDPEDVGTEEIMGFAEELSVSFPIVWDKEKKTANAYSPPKMPTSYIIDKQGVVQHIHAGYQADEADKMSAEIEALMK